MDSQPPLVMTVVGARPQFVKLGPVSRHLQALGLSEFLVHTGQHYSFKMSQSFFEELDLPTPDANLGIAEPNPARQLGAMVPALSDVMAQCRPGLVVVFGDTTSTVAAALAAAYAGIPVAHVEAGMRSFDPAMPEEIARVVTDRTASLWFTASRAAGANLAREGLGPVDFVGDVMHDVVREVADDLADPPEALARLGAESGEFLLATLHRAKNTDEPDRLERIVSALTRLPLPVIFPVHPRTRAALDRFGLADRLVAGRIRAVVPLRYLETIGLIKHARRVFTDSGGVQKEAFYLDTPCTTLREETEWVETVEVGWNILAGADGDRILASLTEDPPPKPAAQPYGDGHSGQAIARRIGDWFAR